MSIFEKLIYERCYPVRQMLKPTKINRMKNIGYNNDSQREAFHIPEDACRGLDR
jgi:hypothetical protein